MYRDADRYTGTPCAVSLCWFPGPRVKRRGPFSISNSGAACADPSTRAAVAIVSNFNMGLPLVRARRVARTERAEHCHPCYITKPRLKGSYGAGGPLRRIALFTPCELI